MSVREVIGRRVARLGDGTRRALEYASVVGRDFDLELLAELLDLDADATFDSLEPAVENTLLEEVAPGRFSFTHALVEHALYNDLTATRRTRLHRRVAEALARHLDHDPGARAGELAYHWAEAGTADDLGRAVIAARVLRPTSRSHTLHPTKPGAGIPVRSSGSPRMRNPTRSCGPRCASASAKPKSKRASPDTARRCSMPRAAPMRWEQRTSSCGPRSRTVAGFASRTGAVDHERIEVLERAIDVALDDRDRAMLLATLSAEVTYTGREPTVRAARDAVTVARRTGDDATLARVVARIERAIASPDTVSEREVLVRDAEAAAIRTRDPVLLWSVASCALHPALERGDRDEYDRRLEMTVEFGNRVGQPQVLWVTGLLASQHAYTRRRPRAGRTHRRIGLRHRIVQWPARRLRPVRRSTVRDPSSAGPPRRDGDARGGDRRRESEPAHLPRRAGRGLLQPRPRRRRAAGQCARLRRRVRGVPA